MHDEEIAALEAQIAALRTMADLEKAVDDAAAAHEAAPSPENYAAHCRAQEALHAHRAKGRGKLKITAEA